MRSAAAPDSRSGGIGQAEPAPIDPDRFRHVLGHYPTGVVIISAIGEHGEPVGMVIGTFTSVSLDPPLVGFFPARASRTWPRIERAGRFCVNMLASDQSDLCRRFASRDADKPDELAFGLSEGGCPVLPGIVGWIDCTLEKVIEAGDHYLVLGKVVAFEIERSTAPMLFCRGNLGAAAMGAEAG